MLQDVMEPQGRRQDPRVGKRYYHSSDRMRKEHLPKPGRSMLGEEANLKAAARDTDFLNYLEGREEGE